MPTLVNVTQKSDSIIITNVGQQDSQEDIYVSGGKWEDEEERRFFEDIPDLRDFVPKSVLGLDETNDMGGESDKKKEDSVMEKERKDREEDEAIEIENELKRLQLEGERDDKDLRLANGKESGTVFTENE